MTEHGMPGIHLPAGFQKGKSLPEDPPMSTTYFYTSEGTEGMLQICPIAARRAMPFDQPEQIIDGIHNNLAESQGLIEVGNGITKAGYLYVYSIVKTFQHPSGVQYTLTMHQETERCIMQLQGFFEERGTTGIRDAIVYTMLESKGIVRTNENGIEGWVKDPYDPYYTRGIPMNLSEDRHFDTMFPNHPLSEARQLVKSIIEEN